MNFYLSIIALFLTIPVVAQREYHVSLKGNDKNNGSAKRPLRTIQAASAKAQPGDMIIVHAGTYREWVRPVRGGSSATKPIVYQAAKGEKVMIKGSEPVSGWVANGKGIWRLALHDTFFGGYNPFTDPVFGDWFFPGKHKVHTGEVYLNETPLYEVDSIAQVLRGDPAKPQHGAVGISAKLLSYTWATEHVADSTIIYANFHEANPNESVIEINTRPACFYPTQTGINYITVRGFHMSQAATQWAAPTAEQIGLIGTNWSKGWVIENNIISDSKCVGITLGKDRASGHNVWFENRQIDGAIHYNDMVKRVIANGWDKENIGSHTVRSNTIFRCGAAGICGSFGAAFSTITGNHIFDICTYRSFWGAEMAGIKFHGAIDALISANRVHNAKMGIWLDWMTQGTRISGNLLYNNDLVDFYPEVNHGPYIVDNNLFLSGMSLRDWSEGGAYIHNLFGGIIGFTPQSRATPFFKPNSTILAGLEPILGGDNRFMNNIFIGSRGRDYVMPPQIASGWDEMDTVKGRGLAMYDLAAQPLSASGNLFLNGAYGLDDSSGITRWNVDPKTKITDKGDEVWMEWEMPNDLLNVPIINSNSLGKTKVSDQSFLDANGKEIMFTSDYFNNKRDAKNIFGPINQTGKMNLRIWPKQ